MVFHRMMEDILLTIQLERLDAPFGVAVRGLDLTTGVSDHEVGDIAIYDTNATLHSATPIDVATGLNDSRVIWRISVHGPPKLGER